MTKYILAEQMLRVPSVSIPVINVVWAIARTIFLRIFRP